MAFDTSSYKELYLQTAKENCNLILENCIKLLKNPSDTDVLQNLYISSHSLKSKSQVMGYSKIEELSGIIEREVKKVLDEKRAISKDLIDRIEEKVEKIRELISVGGEIPRLRPDASGLRSG